MKSSVAYVLLRECCSRISVDILGRQLGLADTVLSIGWGVRNLDYVLRCENIMYLYACSTALQRYGNIELSRKMQLVEPLQ